MDLCASSSVSQTHAYDLATGVESHPLHFGIASRPQRRITPPLAGKPSLAGQKRLTGRKWRRAALRQSLLTTILFFPRHSD
jgi:hypothetical protein